MSGSESASERTENTGNETNTGTQEKIGNEEKERTMTRDVLQSVWGKTRAQLLEQI